MSTFVASSFSYSSQVLSPLFCGAAHLHSAGGPSLCEPSVDNPERLPGCVGWVFCDQRPELILIAVLQLDVNCLDAGDVCLALGVGLLPIAALCFPLS